MAVVWAKEHWEGREGSFENVINNRLTRTWKVKTNDVSDDALVIADHFDASLGIRFLSPHPRNAFYTARNLDPKQESESPYFWRVTVIYSTEPLGEEEDKPENPLERPAEISGESEMSQIFTTKDKDGKPVLNSAGDCLEPHELDDPRGVIIIDKNFATIPTWLSEYVNKVNSTDFSIPGFSSPFAARTVKMQRFRFEKAQVQNDVTFVPVSIELSVKKDTWDVDRLDEGFHEVTGGTVVSYPTRGISYRSGGTKAKITLDDNNEPTEPVPLDGTGQKLTDPTPDNAVYMTVKYHEEADFSVIFS